MIGVDVEIKNNKVIKKKFFNNQNKILKLRIKNYFCYIIGDIYENKSELFSSIDTFLRKKKYKQLSNFNGEYFIYIKKKNKLIIVNSKNSYIPIFYNFSKKNLYLKSNLLKFDKIFYKKVNFNKITEWFLFNGRSFDNKTFLKDVNVLDPGQVCIFKHNKVRNYFCKPFSYTKKSNLNESENIDNVLKSLKYAINLRLNKNKKNVSFALSGGLDSRILLSLIDKNNKKFIRTHTHGTIGNFEGVISKRVSKLLKYKHRFFEIKLSEYYKYALDSVQNGSFSTIFKNGVKTKYSKKIKKFDNSKYFMMGNALDVLIASSFSSPYLKKVKTLTSFIKWYKKNYVLFTPEEISKIFNNKLSTTDKKIDNILKKSVKKFKYNNDFIDLNDALTFESRIKRWHNPSLALQSRISNFLIPTYDKYFLKSCSEINSKYRINNIFRKKLLKKINPKLASIPTSNSFETNKKYKKQQYKFYDSNLGLDIKNNKEFSNMYQFIKKKIIKSSFSSFMNFNYLDRMILNHKNNKKDYSRKIFMIITFLIILIFISKKQKHA